MAFNFSEDEYASIQGGPVTTNAVSDADIEQLRGDIDEQMSEVERRLEKAQYYRMLMGQDLFSETSEIGNEVQKEVRQFIRQQMAVLVGASAPGRPATPPQALFSEEETRVLKEVAKKLIRHPIRETPPVVKPAPVPVTQVVKPAPAPALKKNAPAPTKKPAPKQPKSKVQTTGEFITIVEADGSKTEYEKHVDSDRGEFYTDGTGRKFVVGTNEKGEKYMRVVSGQAMPAGVDPIKSPNRRQFEQLSASHASSTLESIAKTNPVIAAAINETLK